MANATSTGTQDIVLLAEGESGAHARLPARLLVEHNASAIASAAAFVVFVVATWRLLFGGRRRAFAHLPGPKPLPFLGNLRELERDGYPRVHQRWVAEYGDVFKCYMGCKETVVVADPELVKEVFVKKFKSFYNRPIAEVTLRQDLKGLVFGRDQYWASARSAVLPLFHSTQLQNYAVAMNDCAALLSQRLEAANKSGDVVNVLEWFQAMTLDVFGKAAFDIDFGLQKHDGKMTRFLKAINDTMNSTTQPGLSVLATYLFGQWLQFPLWDLLSYLPGTVEWRDRHSFTIVDRESYALLASRRASVARAAAAPAGASTTADAANDAAAEGGRKDLLSLLAKARLKGTAKGLSDEEVVRLLTELITAGYETTATTLAFAVLLLASHPEVEAKMVAEIRSKFTGQPLTLDDMKDYPYVEMVVKEAQRLFPTGAVVEREANEATTVGSLVVPKGSVIVIPVFALHRHPKYFSDAGLFKPERFDPKFQAEYSFNPYAYIPFGAGPRMCIGYKFALQEACLTLIHIYSRFSFSLDGDFSKLSGKEVVNDLPIDAGFVIKPRGGLQVRVHLREQIQPSAC